MKRTRSYPQKRNDDKKINDAITHKELAVISDEWEFLGAMKLSEARQFADSKDLDLVEMGGMKDWLPIAKVMDYGKYIFKQQKQLSHNKSNTKKTEMKTMKLTYKIGEHDLDVRRKQAEKWAKEWNPMKILLQLRWRENQYEDLAIEKIQEFIASVEGFYKKDEKSKLQKQGNAFNVILHPKK